MDLTVRIGKSKLKSPVICASGTFGFGDELRGLADFSSIGAVITKTITLKPRKGNPPPRIYEAECGVINSIGLENPGLDGFIRDKLPALKKIAAKHFISVGGATKKEYAEVIKELDKKSGVDGFELNLSCPNLRNKKLISQSRKSTAALIEYLRKTTKKTLIAKLTPEVADIAKTAKTAESSGADAVSLVNTYFSLAVDIESGSPYLGSVSGGYSGPGIKPMSLYKVWQAAQAVKIPLIGGGGISGYKDAVEFLLAGAAAVSLGTVNLTYPAKTKDVLQGVKDYLARKKISSLDKLRRI